MLAPYQPRLDSECQFVADPDDPYRYVCLRCGQERSLKKKPETALDPGFVTVLIGAAIATILLFPLLEARQPPPAPTALPSSPR